MNHELIRLGTEFDAIGIQTHTHKKSIIAMGIVEAVRRLQSFGKFI